MKQDYAEVARRHPLGGLLRDRGIKIHAGGRFLCPFHPDTDPSASIFRADDGVEKGMCHSKQCPKHGKIFDSVQFLADQDHNGDRNKAVAILESYTPMSRPQPKPADQEPELQLGDIPEDKIPVAGRGPISWTLKTDPNKRVSFTPDMVHVYRDRHGNAHQLIVRRILHTGKKDPRQVSWDMARQDFVGTRRKGAPLYGAHLLAKHPDKPVLVVEGEKCVDVLPPELLHSHVVVTWMGGTSNVKHADFSALEGRDVTWWPDADVPEPDQIEGVGEKAMREAMAMAKARVNRWIEPLQEWRDAKPGYDVADLLAAHEDVQVVREVLDDLPVVIQPPAVADEPEPPTSRVKASDWLPEGLALDHTEAGNFATKSETNCFLALAHHPAFKGRITFDVFDREVLIDGEIATDMRISYLAAELGAKVRVQIKHDTVGKHVMGIARENPVNRLADHLRSLKWDGKTRYLLDYAGVEPTLWSQTVSRRWGVGLVRRILEPGTQHDGVLVLEGAQGVGKTTFLTILGESFGRELLTTLHSLKLEGNNAMQLNGRAIVDMSEFTAHKRADAETFKGLTTARDDDYRVPYAKSYVKVKRTCVFAATTNKSLEYLNDPTGNRRIWPVVVTSRPDRDRLRADLEQIWAELVTRAQEGEPNHLLPPEEALQTGEAGKREMVEPWQDIVEDAVGEAQIVTVKEIWLQLGMDGSKQNGSNHERLHTIMRKLGFEKRQARYEGKSTKCWVRS